MDLRNEQRCWRMVFFTLALVAALAITTQSDARAATPNPFEQQGIYLPVVMVDACKAVAKRPQSVFGVQMYGSTNSDRAYFTEMVDSNTSWVRVEVPWRSAAPENVPPDEFRWETIDKVLAASAQAGIHMIGTVNHNPSWAADSGAGPIDPEYLDEFAQFTQALVERYDGDGIDDAPCGREVHHWEFYNEPDNTGHWGYEGDRYAEMLAAAYPVMKAADPDTQVLFGGIAYDWFVDQDGHFVRNFLPDVLEAGGGAHFDVMSFHVYPAFAPNWTTRGPGLTQKAAAIRAELAEYDLDKPLAITESGAHSNDEPGSPSTPAIQASYVVELFTQTKAADIEMLIWFMLYDPNEDYPYRNGLVTIDSPPQRKLAFNTFRLAVDLLAAADFDRQLTDEETGDADMLAYRFVQSNSDKALYVAWMNPVDTGQTARLALSEEAVVIHDIYGNKSQVSDGGDGVLVVDVGREPVVITAGR